MSQDFYEGAMWVIREFIESAKIVQRKDIASDYWLLRFEEAKRHLIEVAAENGVDMKEAEKT